MIESYDIHFPRIHRDWFSRMPGVISSAWVGARHPISHVGGQPSVYPHILTFLTTFFSARLVKKVFMIRLWTFLVELSYSSVCSLILLYRRKYTCMLTNPTPYHRSDVSYGSKSCMCTLMALIIRTITKNNNNTFVLITILIMSHCSQTESTAAASEWHGAGYFRRRRLTHLLFLCPSVP